MACLYALVCGAVLLGCPSDPLDEVRALQAQGHLLESLPLLEALVEERPDDPEIHFLYGVTCVQTGRASLGMWSLRRAREFEGWEVRAGVELARAGIDTGDNASSIEAASAVLEIEPEQRPALDIRAEALVRQGDYEAALLDVTRLRELTRNDGSVELLALRSLIGMRRIGDAEALFTELEARRAKGELELPVARYCSAQAIFASERGDTAVAGETFTACLEAHPTDSLLLESALKFFDAQQDFARSLEILERALEEEPRALQVRQLLGRRLRVMGRPEDAERVLLEGTELQTAAIAATSWGALAVHDFELEDFAAAASAWSRLFELVPEPGSEVLLAYAEALALSGEHERALALAKDLPAAHRHLLQGRVRLEQRRAEQALEDFDAAIRLWPDNAAARYYAARAAEHTGDFERAISEYRASVRADPEATDAGL
jgi:tetratricopeptide (TPR) repeat protein